jgi:hypothetical protein
MDTLSDYIRWMGDYPCSCTGFHEPDAVLLSLLSYIDYTPVIQNNFGKIRLRECLPFVEKGDLQVMIIGEGKAYCEILKLAAESRRFGDLFLTDYLDLQREEPPLQFSAVCFEDEDYSFLAFRGTDSSLAGWKEDFMISFTRTEAQELALAYAQRHLRPGRRWYMGGHSKGGNELLYAASMLTDEQLESVERIFLLDGPGLCPEVMSLEGMQRLDKKTTRIIPEFSVIGQLFKPDITDTRIVRSTAIGLQQHGLVTWGIDYGKLAYADDNDTLSKWINETLALWIGDITQEERPVFVDELFDALSAGGATDFKEFGKDGTEGLEAVLKQFRNSSEMTKKTISELPKQALRLGVDQLRQRIGDSVPKRTEERE